MFTQESVALLLINHIELLRIFRAYFNSFCQLDIYMLDGFSGSLMNVPVENTILKCKVFLGLLDLDCLCESFEAHFKSTTDTIDHLSENVTISFS